MNVSKIVGLRAQNVMKLKVVEIKPGDDPLVVIGGKNKQGKSAVLNAVLMGIGGADFINDEPIRRGFSSARIDLDLGDIIVTRTFSRDIIHKDDCDILGPKGQECSCKSKKFGEVRTSLKIKSKDGQATYNSPQTLLDSFYSRVAFDPQEFANADEKKQAEMLRRLVNLDTTKFDRIRQDAYSRRTQINRQVKALDVKLKDMPVYDGVPAEEVNLEEINGQLTAAEQARAAHALAVDTFSNESRRVAECRASVDTRKKTIADLEAQLAKEKAGLKEDEKQLASFEKMLKLAETKVTERKAAIPDTESIQARLLEIQEVNAKVRANMARAAVVAERDSVQAEADTKSSAIAKADADKQAAIAAVEFPVEGLGFDDNGVTFNGLPFSVASTAEQLQVSIAIGLAMHPKLKVLLIRNGNALDAEAMQVVADMATKAGAQIWMEFVTRGNETEDGVTVLIEDGEVAP